jgi:lysyl-tRNA synthetase class 2
MNELRLESSTLRALAYDDGREILQLEFCSRAIYHYYGVPAAIYKNLLGAPSKGSYFNRVIRGRFPYALCASAQTGLAGER